MGRRWGTKAALEHYYYLRNLNFDDGSGDNCLLQGLRILKPIPFGRTSSSVSYSEVISRIREEEGIRHLVKSYKRFDVEARAEERKLEENQ